MLQLCRSTQNVIFISGVSFGLICTAARVHSIWHSLALPPLDFIIRIFNFPISNTPHAARAAAISVQGLGELMRVGQAVGPFPSVILEVGPFPSVIHGEGGTA